jgi:hypothetical protein
VASLKRCKLFQALAAKAQASHAMLFCLFPLEVRAGVQIPKGKLELAPVTFLCNISSKHVTGATEAIVSGTSLWLTEPSRPRAAEASAWKHDVAFAPFWWVGTTAEQAEVNVNFKKYVKDDVTFHVLTNTRMIKQHEKLLMLEKAKVSEEEVSIAPLAKRGRSA